MCQNAVYHMENICNMVKVPRTQSASILQLSYAANKGLCHRKQLNMCLWRMPYTMMVNLLIYLLECVQYIWLHFQAWWKLPSCQTRALSTFILWYHSWMSICCSCFLKSNAWAMRSGLRFVINKLISISSSFLFYQILIL